MWDDIYIIDYNAHHALSVSAACVSSHGCSVRAGFYLLRDRVSENEAINTQTTPSRSQTKRTECIEGIVLTTLKRGGAVYALQQHLDTLCEFDVT